MTHRPAEAAVAGRQELYDPEQRFKAYVRDYANPGSPSDPICLAAAATPEALGLALVTIAREHVQYAKEPHPPVGVLDTLDRKWLVTLWNRSQP